MIRWLMALDPIGKLIAGCVLAAALLLIGTLGYRLVTGPERARAEQARVEREARAETELSQGVAAQEREVDKTTIEQDRKERDNAVTTTTNSSQKPSAASNALNCERLRRTGRDVSQLPACRGRAGGGEATTH